MTTSFKSVSEMLTTLRPKDPVYCVYPHIYADAAREFIDGFPGRVLYAVKANNEAPVIQALVDAGIRHFDCASLQEIKEVRAVTDQGTCYFMNPVRIRDEARIAQETFGVRHFVTDHPEGLRLLLAEIDPHKSVIFVRMAVHHESSMVDLSSKFGAPPEMALELLEAVRQSGAEPGFAFNVGSHVMSPDAYVHAIKAGIAVLEQLPFRVRLVDIGGGYAKKYPGFDAPPIADYLAAIRDAANFVLSDDGELMAEPGRALAAPGLSAVVEVLLRKDQRLYINDGLYGVFWELRYHAHEQYPARVFRGGKQIRGATEAFEIMGPTCDSGDKWRGHVELPADIQIGDYIEFGEVGAYSVGGRSDFNGFYSDQVVTITDANSVLPQVDPV
ncbi:MAG: type III PLP-dependent enzyme [Pseudomonadota bacterium]